MGDWKARNKEGFLLKLNFEKACEKVDWAYLDGIMDYKGFGNRWRKWMKNCLSTANFSILINGRPRGKFFVKRGLRQRDPLSPFLFILMGDSLSRTIHFCCERRFILNNPIGRVGVVSPIFNYVDDTLIFCQHSDGNLERWWMLLVFFLEGSGLSLNPEKTSLIGINVDREVLNRGADYLGCKTEELPFKYLEVPLGGNHHKASFWDPIVDSLRAKMTKWRNLQLSKGGQLTLALAVFNSLPIYAFSICSYKGD